MSHCPTARPRVPSVLSALLLTLATTLALAPALVAQAQVTGLSETEITVGSTFEITGSGFGTKTPKVFLAQDGVQVKGTTLKVLKPVADDLLTVEVRKAVAGDFTVVVDPSGKANEPGESEDTIEVVRPLIVMVEGDGAALPDDEVTIQVQDLGDGKPQVRMANLKAKVLSTGPVASEGEAELTAVTFRVPKKIPSGTWEIQVSNAVGGDTLPAALIVTGGRDTLGKEGVQADLVGFDSISASRKKTLVEASFQGPTRIQVDTGGKEPERLEIVTPFVLGNEQAPRTDTRAPAAIRLFDAQGREWISMDDAFSLSVGATSGGLMSGSFTAELLPVEEGVLPSRTVHGRFTVDGGYDLDAADGNTPRDIAKGVAWPGINIQVLELGGARGPTGNYQAGDDLLVTFRIAKDDGSAWSLSEMDATRAAVSGPTFNMNRVIGQVSDIRTAAEDLGNGIYRYRFPGGLPDVYLPPLNDSDAFGPEDGELTGMPLLDGTYLMGLWFQWDYTSGGQSFRGVGEVTVDFLIGASVAAVEGREVVSDQNCNACHSVVQAHGGSRRTVGICLLCHTTGSEDRNVPDVAGGTPGVSVDFKIMIHKIHNGAHLPSVQGMTTVESGARDYTVDPEPYVLVGFNNSINDFSHVEFPVWPNFVATMPRDFGYSDLDGAAQDKEDAVRGGATDCDTCHGDPDGMGPLEPPAQGQLAYMQPTTNTCLSCHDDWVPEFRYTQNTGAGMPDGLADSSCIGCHPAEGNSLAVRDGHLHPLVDPTIATGVNYTILAVDESGMNDGSGTIDPGEKVALTFTVTDSDGISVDPAGLVGTSVFLTGPTTNKQTLLGEQSLAADLLTGPQPFTVNVPMDVDTELVFTATDGPDEGATEFTPHLAVASRPTQVFEQTATGFASTLTAGAGPARNYVDVADGSGFARNDDILVDAGEETAEYLRIQWVDGDRLWFSSPYTQAYKAAPVNEHLAGANVQVVTLTELTEGVEYMLTPGTGTITEIGGAFTDGANIVCSYGTDFVMPEAFPVALNAYTDLGERDGGWAGKSVVPGTYTLTMWGSQSVTLELLGETNTYRDGGKGVSQDFLVMGATQIQPYDLVTSLENCASCHVDIQFHGSNRRGFESCFSCHGTAATGDRPAYVAPGTPENPAPATERVTVNFREMIHKIHRGADLAKADEYTVLGFGPPNAYPFNFSEHTYENVRFPAMPAGSQDCSLCHGDESEAWFFPNDRTHPTEQELPGREWNIACGSCHDSDSEVAHIEAQSSPVDGAESCMICHGPGQTWDVETYHQVR